VVEALGLQWWHRRRENIVVVGRGSLEEEGDGNVWKNKMKLYKYPELFSNITMVQLTVMFLFGSDQLVNSHKTCCRI
jgi:hypothetical protein